MSIRSSSTTVYDTETGSVGVLNTPTPQYGQGPADPVRSGSIDANNNSHGYTHPDLHRTIDPSDPQLLTDEVRDETVPGELEPRQYSVGIYGRDSYRTTHKIVHTEEEFVRDAGEAAKSPTWTQHTSASDTYISGGDSAQWNVYPPEANPLSRGTPDEIP